MTLGLTQFNPTVKSPLGFVNFSFKSSVSIYPTFNSLRFIGPIHIDFLVSTLNIFKDTKSSGSGEYFGAKYSNIPPNTCSSHFPYILKHLIGTGGGCILKVAKLKQYLNRSRISLEVSTISNKSCLYSKSFTLVLLLVSSVSTVLSSLSLLSISLLLSDSIFS